MVPVSFILICNREQHSDIPSVFIFAAEGSMDYMILYFILYASEVLLAALAICTLYVKTVQVAGTSASCPASTAAQRNLRSLVMFSIAPALVQIPYAVRQVATVVDAPNMPCRGSCDTVSCQDLCGRYV